MKTLEQYVKCVQIRNKNLETVGGICSKLNKDTATESEICWKSTIKTLEQCLNLFKVNNKDNRTMSEICSKLAIKTLRKYVKFADNEDTRRLWEICSKQIKIWNLLKVLKNIWRPVNFSGAAANLPVLIDFSRFPGLPGLATTSLKTSI